jgi:Flp pilus assembly protein TadD
VGHSLSKRHISRWRFLALGGIVLLVITVIAYAEVLENGFVKFDDDTYVTNNPHTLAGLSRDGFRYAWTTFDLGNWIPVTFLSYQLDVTLFGVDAAGFHATSLGLHCSNVLLLFLWLVRVTGSQWRSLTVAALFAVHPLHVESAAWIAERKDVLSTFWLLVALFAYENYAQQFAVKWYLATTAAFVLGLLSKSMLVTLPLLLLLIDIWPLARWTGASGTSVSGIGANGRTYPRRTSRQLVLEKLPLLAISLADGIVTIIAQPKMSIASLPFSYRFGNSLAGYGWYIAKTFWPTDLSVLYLHPMKNLDSGAVALAALLLVTISLHVGLAGSRRSHLLFGWLWFLIALLPVIGLIQVGTQAHADRYSYIPHIGLLVMIVWEGQYWLDRIPAGRLIAGAAAVGATAACISMTMSQVAVWRNADTLFAQALSVDPDNWVVHELVGGLRLRTGQFDEAYEHYRLVLKARPKHSDALSNLAGIYQWHGERALAEDYYRQALAANAGNATALHSLVALLKRQDRIADASDVLEAYIQQQPDDAAAHFQLGIVLENAGELKAARDHFGAAFKLKPLDNDARQHLHAVEKRLGDTPGL